MASWHFIHEDYFAVINHVCLYCHNCYNSASDAVVRTQCTCHEMQWSWVRILAGMVLRKRQCTLEGDAQYVNIQGSVHWEGVYSVGKCTWQCNFFCSIRSDQKSRTKYIIKIAINPKKATALIFGSGYFDIGSILKKIPIKLWESLK